MTAATAAPTQVLDIEEARSSNEYRIWVVECGRVPDFPEGGRYAGRFNAGTVELPFGFVLLAGEGHVALVDCGYLPDGSARQLVESTGLSHSHRPDEVLSSIGINPEAVDTILLTHAHWDHAGGLRAFPNATIWMQERELSEWMRLLSWPERFSSLWAAVDRADLAALSEALAAGRLQLADGPKYEVLPGIDLLPTLDTHTAGHQCVVIRSGPGGPWLVAGDAIMALDNLGGESQAYVPISNLQGSVVRLLEDYDAILAAVGGDRTAS